MTFTKRILSVSTLALAVAASYSFAEHVNTAASEPSYNPATVARIDGVVTAIKQVAPGNPLAGVHLAVKSKTGTVDLYLGPADFLRFLKAGFPVGDQIEALGSKVKADGADVVLTQSIDDGFTQISLRDARGNADWLSWGREIDPSLVQ